MPIRINLLAEAQAAEELRRKDPVKRVLYGAGFVVFLVALWSATLQMKIMATGSDLKGLDSQWTSIKGPYEEAVRLQREAIEVGVRISALNNLATNRFVWGTALNALQQTLDGIEGVKMLRIGCDQNYVLTEDVPPVPGTDNKGRPATSTEQISILIEAIDASETPGGQVAAFKDKLATVPFLAESLQQTNGVRLASLSAPQLDEVTGRSFVRFTMRCFFPDKVR